MFQSKTANSSNAIASVEKKIEEFFQQSPEPSPSLTKRAANEENMDTNDMAEELFSPQVTPKPLAFSLATHLSKDKEKEKATGAFPSDFDIFLSRDDTLDLELKALESGSALNVEETLIIPPPSLDIGVIPSLTLNRLTFTPQNGFPKVYGLSLKKLCGNIAKDTKDVWNTLASPLVLVMVSYIKPTRGFSASYVSKLSTAITLIIGRAEDLTVTPSKLIITKFPTLLQPFAITGILPNQAEALVNKQC
ncbi:hypothetical protein H1R20_g15263, partial [Candolleomyces eurysporus]